MKKKHIRSILQMSNCSLLNNAEIMLKYLNMNYSPSTKTNPNRVLYWKKSISMKIFPIEFNGLFISALICMNFFINSTQQYFLLHGRSSSEIIFLLSNCWTISIWIQSIYIVNPPIYNIFIELLIRCRYFPFMKELLTGS